MSLRGQYELLAVVVAIVTIVAGGLAVMRYLGWVGLAWPVVSAGIWLGLRYLNRHGPPGKRDLTARSVLAWLWGLTGAGLALRAVGDLNNIGAVGILVLTVVVVLGLVGLDTEHKRQRKRRRS